MASFYAELEVTGHTYPVRVCQFSFTQATDERGRVRGKVRHGLVHLSLDTPHDDFLLNWGTTVNKPLAGHVTFFETNQRTARETMSFAAGECVGYHETFDAGDGGAGAYISHLTIAATKLVLSAGGPLRPFVAAKARGYAAPKAMATAPVVAVPRLPLVTGDPPFNCKPSLNRTEFVRQLTGQQVGMNQLTVAEFLANIKAYDKRRAQTGDGRDPKGNIAQQKAREKALADKTLELRREIPTLSKKQATQQAEKWMKTQAALHNPDQVAGGHADIVTGVGDKRVNSSIGAQWPGCIEPIKAKIKKLAATMSAKEQASTYLNIALPLA